MPDIEQSILQWRRQMLVAGIRSPAVLAELESHLRDHVEQGMKSDMDPAAAFAGAVERLGDATLLQAEFQKNQALNQTRLRRRAALVFAGLMAVYSVIVTRVLLTSDLTLAERLSGFVSIGIMLLSTGFVWRVLPRFFPLITTSGARSVLGLAGGISGMLWFLVFVYFLLPHFAFTPGELKIALLWAMVPTLLLPASSFLMIDKSEQADAIAQ